MFRGDFNCFAKRPTLLTSKAPNSD
uniref:Uncharacterized protein n=1 Tax=Anguilla anguilla TaxID=7936 RepID=A0A0E9XL23_ANGAN